MDDVLLVHGCHGQEHLCGVEPAARFGEAVLLLDPEEELAAARVLEHHVQLLGGLEGADEMDQEGAVDALEHDALRLGVVDLAALDDLGLS